MRIFVPFDARDPNTRLAPLFSPEERRQIAESLLTDVLEAIRGAGHEPELIATGPVERDCPVHVDERSLTEAVNARLERSDRPVGIVMADLGLATAASIDRLADQPGDVVLAPGLGGGTNAIVSRDPAFRVDYHGGSYRKHRRGAEQKGLSVGTVDSFRLAVDIDEPADLAELLLHGDGESTAWLREHDVSLEIVDGRCTVRRPSP